MSTLAYILIFTFIGSIGALIGGLILISKRSFALKFSPFLASFAAGTFLGAAFFDLIPEASHKAEELGLNIYPWILFGIIFFFLLERFIHWFHHHDSHHESHHEHQRESRSTIPLIVIGDTAHNFVDGVVIAATFLVSIPFGIVTTFAVAAHEIPQEIGDFGLLIHKGLARRDVVLINVLSASAAFIGALLAYSLGSSIEDFIPFLLAITAGFFIYIATSDLIPEINYEKRRRYAAIKSFLLILGVATIFVSVSFLEHGR